LLAESYPALPEEDDREGVGDLAGHALVVRLGAVAATRILAFILVGAWLGRTRTGSPATSAGTILLFVALALRGLVGEEDHGRAPFGWMAT